MELSSIQQRASISDIRNRTTDVTARLINGPVLLTKKATPQAVMVSPTQWNAIVERLEEMQDTIIILQAELEIATGQSEVETVTDPVAFMGEMMKMD
jgi:hypothetical protein